MTKLSDTQSILLSTASTRETGSLLPVPETVRAKGAVLDRTLRALLSRDLTAEVGARSDAATWRTEETGRRIGLRITSAGYEAIGIDAPDTPDAPAAPARRDAKEGGARPGGKLGILLGAVSGKAGATLDELAAATGWQKHTTRAALTRLRQRGFGIALAERDGRKAYHLTPAA